MCFCIPQFRPIWVIRARPVNFVGNGGAVTVVIGDVGGKATDLSWTGRVGLIVVRDVENFMHQFRRRFEVFRPSEPVGMSSIKVKSYVWQPTQLLDCVSHSAGIC